MDFRQYIIYLKWYTASNFMRWLLVLSIVALAGCNADKIATLEKENKELSARLEQLSKQNNLDLQEKCAKQAKAEFESEKWDARKYSASYTNHYNAKANKCFIEVISSSIELPYKPNTFRTISDAFEGKVYADYYWVNDKGKKYWEVAPFTCKITTLRGEEMNCKSTDEYEELIKQFMND